MKPEEFLKDLADKLHAIKRGGLATQAEIEAETGVDQTTISRAMNLERRRVTEPLRILMKYADMRLEPSALSPAIGRAVGDFLRRGGSEAELIASIEHATVLVSGRLRSRSLD